MRTWDVQTLLKITNTTVCENHVKTRSSFRRPKRKPNPSANPIWGTKLVKGDRRMRLQDDERGSSKLTESVEG